MGVLLLPLHYVWWHYVLVWLDIARLYIDFIAATANLFSLKILVRTWWLPWRRLGEAYPNHFSPGEYLSTFIINTLMRMVGIIIRSILLVVGVVACVLVALAGLLGVALWLILPFIILALVVLGVALMVGITS